MTIGRTTVKTLNNIEKSLSMFAVLSNFQSPFIWGMLCDFKSKIMGVRIFCQKYWAKDCFLLVDLSYENSATYEILSFKITSILHDVIGTDTENHQIWSFYEMTHKVSAYGH